MLHKAVVVLKMGQRETLLRQITAAMHEYNSEKSEAFEYFGFEEEEIETNALLDEFLNKVEDDTDMQEGERRSKAR